MRVGSLFTGIGGIDLGLERAGFTIAWQCEIDPYCRAVLCKHWPDVPCYDDVRGVHAARLCHGDRPNETGRPCKGCLQPVDLLCGGFPCQPFSNAGRRRGTADPRWLWPDFARIVRELQPRYVLVENVDELRTHALGDVTGDLAARGYDAEWDCLPAAAFGAPHIRDRLYLLAYSSERRPVPQGQTVFAGWTRAQLHAGWTPEPRLARVVDGPSGGVDGVARKRRRVIGAAVVPQVVEYIGRRILEVDRG